MSIEWIWLIFLIVRRFKASAEDLQYRIQPHPVRINDFDDVYITNDQQFLPQVLYRQDKIHFSCECISEIENSNNELFWSINEQIRSNSTMIELLINDENVREPITSVTCHCIFQTENSSKIEKNYRYQLYIDLKNEPSLKSIQYKFSTHRWEYRWIRFCQHTHIFIIGTFLGLIVILTGSMLVVQFLFAHCL